MKSFYPRHDEQIIAHLKRFQEEPSLFMKTLEEAARFQPRYPGRTAIRLIEITIEDSERNFHVEGLSYWVFSSARDMQRKLARQPEYPSSEDVVYGWQGWDKGRVLTVLANAPKPFCKICLREKTTLQEASP